MTKYEYKVIKVSLGDARQATAMLNEHGVQGWDAFQSVPHNQDVIIFLKRELLGYTGPREKRPAEKPEEKPEENGKRKPGRPRKVSEEVDAALKELPQNSPDLAGQFPGD